MKIYSNDTVSKSMLDEQLSAVDAKQAQQIQQLRLWVAASFVVNALLAVALFAIA